MKILPTGYEASYFVGWMLQFIKQWSGEEFQNKKFVQSELKTFIL
jgi:hypothetical protein